MRRRMWRALVSTRVAAQACAPHRGVPHRLPRRLPHRMARLEPRPRRVVGHDARDGALPTEPTGLRPRSPAATGRGTAALPNGAQSAHARNCGLFLLCAMLAFLTAASEIYRRSPKY